MSQASDIANLKKKVAALEAWRHDTVDPTLAAHTSHDTTTDGQVADHETRIDALEGAEPPDPEPPPAEDEVEVFVTDSTDTYYDAVGGMTPLTPAEHAGVAVSSIRMAPYPSPIINGQAVLNTEVQIEVPDLVMKYRQLPGQTGPAFWAIGANAAFEDLPLEAEHIIEAECEFTGASGGVFKGMRLFHTLGHVQWSTQRGALPYSGPLGTGSPFQAYPNSGFTDELVPYPQGHDQGTQPTGPYLEQLFNTGKHLFKWGIRPHSAIGVYDGEMYLDIGGVRVMHVALSKVGEVPPAGFKQWCGIEIVKKIPVGLRITEGFAFGGTQYVTNQPEWKFKVDIDSIRWIAKVPA